MPNGGRIQKRPLPLLGVPPLVVSLLLPVPQLQRPHHPRLYPPREPLKPPLRHQVSLFRIGILVAPTRLSVARFGQFFPLTRRRIQQVDPTRLVPLAAFLLVLQQNQRDAQLPLLVALVPLPHRSHRRTQPSVPKRRRPTGLPFAVPPFPLGVLHNVHYPLGLPSDFYDTWRHRRLVHNHLYNPLAPSYPLPLPLPHLRPLAVPPLAPRLLPLLLRQRRGNARPLGLVGRTLVPAPPLFLRARNVVFMRPFPLLVPPLLPNRHPLSHRGVAVRLRTFVVANRQLFHPLPVVRTARLLLLVVRRGHYGGLFRHRAVRRRVLGLRPHLVRPLRPPPYP